MRPCTIDAALHNSDVPYVQASGEATISVKPDQAVIDIGVITEATTSVAASAQNAAQTEAVVAELSRLLGDSKNVKTTTYTLRPKYDVRKNNAITGYSATNIVEVKVDNLANVSKVIDASTQSGANAIQKLQFQLKNPGIVHAQALREAAEQAKTNAEAIAAGLGLKVLKVISAEELTPEDGFGMAKRAPNFMGRSVGETPVEVGTIDVDVHVIVRVAVGQ